MGLNPNSQNRVFTGSLDTYDEAVERRNEREADKAITFNILSCGVNEEEVPVVEKAEKFLYIL